MTNTLYLRSNLPSDYRLIEKGVKSDLEYYNPNHVNVRQECKCARRRDPYLYFLRNTITGLRRESLIRSFFVLVPCLFFEECVVICKSVFSR